MEKLHRNELTITMKKFFKSKKTRKLMLLNCYGWQGIIPTQLEAIHK